MGQGDQRLPGWWSETSRSCRAETSPSLERRPPGAQGSHLSKGQPPPASKISLDSGDHEQGLRAHSSPIKSESSEVLHGGSCAILWGSSSKKTAKVRGLAIRAEGWGDGQGLGGVPRALVRQTQPSAERLRPGWGRASARQGEEAPGPAVQMALLRCLSIHSQDSGTWGGGPRLTEEASGLLKDEAMWGPDAGLRAQEVGTRFQTQTPGTRRREESCPGYTQGH